MFKFQQNLYALMSESKLSAEEIYFVLKDTIRDLEAALQQLQESQMTTEEENKEEEE